MLNPAIPEALEWVCLKCLEREPRRRYRGVAAWLEDLRRHRDGHPVHARPASRWERCVRWCRHHPKAAAGIAGAIVATGFLAGTVTWLWRGRCRSGATDRARRSLLYEPIRVVTRLENGEWVVEVIYAGEGVESPRVERSGALSGPWILIPIPGPVGEKVEIRLPLDSAQQFLRAVPGP